MSLDLSAILHQIVPGRGAPFSGRAAELAQLEQTDAGLVVIHGSAGCGKTSLAAEAISRQHQHFDLVLSNTGSMAAEALYKSIDMHLSMGSPAYRARCAANELAHVFITPAQAAAQGVPRGALMLSNLLEAMTTERILVVLDDVTACFLPSGEAKDPALDVLLELGPARLRGSGSRLMLTSAILPLAAGEDQEPGDCLILHLTAKLHPAMLRPGRADERIDFGPLVLGPRGS